MPFCSCLLRDSLKNKTFSVWRKAFFASVLGFFGLKIPLRRKTV